MLSIIEKHLPSPNACIARLNIHSSALLFKRSLPSSIKIILLVEYLATVHLEIRKHYPIHLI
ncbi:hypothetical protein X471_01221 [Bartonella bacilliformis str. Heidi Mejia]|nr:hypothetical protein X471_01221 [Bartonella bacilliformis str. Heidi Mejia]KEG18207.1 hypothetical protein H707_00965 [Bartonella bacilliformis Hosp800-02]KEG23570.1 hypothetical protein H706_00983 [Bartonella bacilliformis CAR600-02]